MKKIFLEWIPFVLLGTVCAALVYGAVQQDLRQNANDPQIQIAEDIAAYMSSGGSLQNVVPQTGTVDLEKSLSVFISIFDDQGKLVASTARIGTTSPLPPLGVLESAKSRDMNVVTWQPSKSARSALVVKHYANAKAAGFIAVGRSLREVEKREHTLLLQVLLAWLVALVTTLGALVISRSHRNEQS